MQLGIQFLRFLFLETEIRSNYFLGSDRPKLVRMFFRAKKTVPSPCHRTSTHGILPEISSRKAYRSRENIMTAEGVWVWVGGVDGEWVEARVQK